MNCDKCGKDMVLEEFVEKAGLCTECYLENGRTKGDVTRDERALTISDIYLAEFVGVLRRVLKKQGDTMTITLWGRLDSWCDEQEEYLEEKYPTESKREPVSLARYASALDISGGAFAGLSELITTGYYAPVDTPERTTASILEEILNAGLDKQSRGRFDTAFYERAAEKAKEVSDAITRDLAAKGLAGEPKEPDIATYIWDEAKPITQEDYERIADRLMKENNRRQTSVSINVDTQAFREGLERIAEQAAEAISCVPLGSRVIVNRVFEECSLEDENKPVCSCRQFQGDSPECPQHGAGSAWYDLHGSE